MTITLELKENDFLEHSVKAFKEKSLNDARKSAEVFCKIVLLKELSEIEANQIIKKQHQTIRGYSLNFAITNLLFNNKIIGNKTLMINKKVKSYLLVLQNHGNLESHDDDSKKLNMDDIEYALFHLAKLAHFLYKEYLEKEIPEKLEILLTEYNDSLKKKIEENNTDWLKIKEQTDEFNPQQQRFILIKDICNNEPILSNLSNINWSYIGDFDRTSHKNGLYFNLNRELSQYRDTNIITLDDPFDYSKSKTVWEFLDGYSERGETLTDTFRKWQKKYINSGKVNNHIEELYDGGISTSDIFIFIFWENIDRLRYLFEYLNILDDIFIDSSQLIFLSTKAKIRDEIQEELKEYENIKKSSIYNLSIENFAVLLKNREKVNSNDITFPALLEGEIEASTEIKFVDFLRYQDDLKLFPYEYENDSIECDDYFRGHLINFKNLNNDCDVERTQGKEIENIVRNRLNNRNSQLIYLLSEPSSGVTTIAYRVLWNIREKYPVIELLNYRRQHTYEFLQKIYTETNKPLLIFADHIINEENIKKMTSELDSKRITYVILYVTRFLDRRDLYAYSKELEKNLFKIPFKVFEKLDRKENDKFYRKLSQNFMSRRDELLELKNRGNTSPFIYNYSIFLDEYQNIDNYVQTKLNGLRDFQKNRTKFLALIQYYTGLNVTIKFLTTQRRKNSLYEADSSMDSLIIYDELQDELKVEFIHNSICEKVLMALSGVQQERAWKQKLVEIGIDFLDFIQTIHPHNKNNEFIKDIVNRLFIKRTITTYDSDTNRGLKYYTDFIEDLDSVDAREKIFKKLVEVYPEDRHFLAHLGRFYSVDKKNFDKSLQYINDAIILSEQEGIVVDSILYHMKGMVYFREVKYRVREKEDIDSIISLGIKSAECFSESREHDSQVNNEYPFISHAKMLLAILDYGKQNFDNDIYKFINEYRSNSFIVNIIDNIENLISDFEVIKTKSDDYGEIKQIRNRLWELQGDIGKSLEMLNNLLSKNTYYNPVLRRNIARLTIKQYDDIIDNIPQQKIKTLIEHLKKNLDGFSLMESNSTDLLLWLRLIRHENVNLNILDISEVLSYIKTILDEETHLTKIQKSIQIIVLYYLHIIKFIQYDKGDNDIYIDLIEIKKELKNNAMYLDGKSLAREWLTNSSSTESIKSVLNWHDKKRLKWVKEDKFFDLQSQKNLKICRGIIKEVKNPKTGIISYKNIDIHFLPRTDFTTSNINEEVEFYLSFSYDEMSAWKVRKN